MNIAIVIGSTGLTGQLLVNELVQSGYFSKVISIVRTKQFKLSDTLEELVFNFNDWQSLEQSIKNTLITNPQLYFFCCLGTTIKKAKTKENFLKIDRDYVIEFAKVAQNCHAKTLFVVSAMGANANSRIFYNRTKGEMENSLLAVFKSGTLKFFRPSLLLGERSEHRFTEKIFTKSLILYNWIFVGPLEKYKPIPAINVAKAMLNSAIKSQLTKDSVFLENKEIFKLSQNN